MAGLARLGRLGAVTEALDPAVMMPAPAQGALAVEAAGPLDAAVEAALAALDHPPTRLAVLAERSLLATLEAGCAAPVGALGRVDGRQAAAGRRGRAHRRDAAADRAEAVAVASDVTAHAAPDLAGAQAGVDAGAAATLPSRAAARPSRLGAAGGPARLDQGAAELVPATREAGRERRSPALAGWTVLVPRGGAWGRRSPPGWPRTVASPCPCRSSSSPHPRTPRPWPPASSRLAAGAYDWLAVTSATTVAALTERGADQRAEPSAGRSLAGRSARRGSPPSVPRPPPPSKALGVRVAWSPARALGGGAARGDARRPGAVLVPHSDLADATLADGLRARGWEVEAAVAYRTVAGPPASTRVRAPGRRRGARGAAHLPEHRRPLLELLGARRPGTVVACIGPTTRAARRARGPDRARRPDVVRRRGARRRPRHTTPRRPGEPARHPTAPPTTRRPSRPTPPPPAQHPAIRRLTAQTRLHPAQLVLPLFVREGAASRCRSPRCPGRCSTPATPCVPRSPRRPGPGSAG